MSRKASPLRRLFLLPVLLSLLPAVATWPLPAKAQTPEQTTKTVVGGQVVAPRMEGRRWLSSEAQLAGATAELFEFRDLYQILEQTLSAGRPKSKPPEPVATDRTDERGFYELSAPEYGRWTLRLSAPGRATDQRTLIAFLPREEHNTVELARGRAVTVQVLDPEGQPVAGARVVGWPEADNPYHLETGLTGDDGKVTLSDAADSPMRVAALAPDYAPAEGIDSGKGTRGESKVLQLRHGLPRRIEVRQGRGLPVPGALVLLGEHGIPAGKTGEDGGLEIRVPLEEPLKVRALAPDLRSASAWIEPAEPVESKAGEESEAPETTEVPEADETDETDEADETGKQAPPVRLDLEALPVASGQVVDAEDRTPLAGVVLWAPDAGEALAVSDRAGGYRLALPDVPTRTFNLIAVLPGYVPRGFPIEPEKANGPQPTLALSPAAAISGTVVDVAGEGISGVEIQVLGRSFQPRGLARSDLQGRFFVPSISPGGSVELTAEKPGYAPATVEIPLLEAGRTVAGLQVVLVRGHSVAGRVIDAEDQPIGEAQVWLLPRSSDSSPMGRFAHFRRALKRADAVSGSEGAFLIEHVAEGVYDLRVEASGFASADVPGIEVIDVGSATDEPLDLGTVVLDRAVQLVGRVVDPDGAPLAGVQIRAMSQSRRFGPPRFDPSESVTDVEGRFSVGEFRNGDRVAISAEHPGYAPSGSSTVQVPVSEPLEIVLQPAASIRGTVRDPEGRPVENAQIRVDRNARSWGFGIPSEHRTDAEGTFTIPEVPPGEITLLAWAEGYLRDAMVHLDVAPGAQLEGVEITLTPGATVSGRVTGPNGEPVIRARVGLLSQSQWGPGGGSVTTDGDGQYRLEGVPTGPRTLSARHGDHPFAVKDLEVRPGDNRLDFRLETGSRVSGRVVDSGGGPVTGVSLWLQPMSPAERRRTVSQSDGTFAFLGVPDGEYQLRGSHPSLGETSREEPLAIRGTDTTGIELRFEGGTTILGRILGLHLDELASIEVTGFSSGGSNQWARPDYEGNFTFEAVSPGNWTIIASSSGQRVTEKVEVVEGVSEVEVVLEFRVGSPLVGRVMMGSEPMSQGSVAAHSATTDSGGFASLDHEGRFRIEGLEDGTYQLRVFGQSGVQHTQEVEVPTDGEVLITLESAQLRGRAVDAVTGEPLSGVTVSLLPEGSDGRTQRMARVFGDLLTDTRGIFRVQDLAAGQYRLVLTKDGYSRTESPITIDPGLSEPVEIRLQPSEGLTLQVSWAPGLIPSNWVQVTATGADGQIKLNDRFPVSERGLIRLGSLPPGTWQIELTAAGSNATIQAVSPGPVVPVTMVPTG